MLPKYRLSLQLTNRSLPYVVSRQLGNYRPGFESFSMAAKLLSTNLYVVPRQLENYRPGFEYPSMARQLENYRPDFESPSIAAKLQEVLPS
jgi:hypothetical protein